MLLKNSHKLHSELDFEAVRRVFSEARADGDLEGEQITSPHDLFSVETLRDSLELRYRDALPVDVFVFGKGEPDRRDCTKVGGAPYWPTDRRWPSRCDGLPYLFLAQFNFSDSTDILPDLPGSVLLLLTEDKEEWLWEPDRIRFEWLPSGCQSLMAVEEARKLELSVSRGVFHGIIYRTEDYPLSEEKASGSSVGGSYDLPVLNGTKIGGVPHFIQGGEDYSGRFLCQLGSIQAVPEVPYPWVNRPEPLSLAFDETGIYGDDNSTVFGDMGSIYIFIDDAGKLTYGFECY